MRRLPIYILVDTSGSMSGEPIYAMRNGIQTLVSTLRRDPYALESVYLSLITFDNKANELFPLTSLEQIEIPEIVAPQSGATFLGAALELLVNSVDRDLIKKTDFRPLLFIMTDGNPSDLQAFRDMILEIKKRRFENIIACVAGSKAKDAIFKELTSNVVHLDTADSNMLTQFISIFRVKTTSFSWSDLSSILSR